MWQTILENLIPLVITVLTPVLLALVHYGLRMVAKKWNMQHALVYEGKVDDLVLKGIRAAEKKSMSALKKDGEKTDGEKKLDNVLQFVNAQLKALKLDEKAAEELKMLVESKLYDEAKANGEIARNGKRVGA